MKKILVTGATGQIGSELVPELRNLYGNENDLTEQYMESMKQLLEEQEKEINPFGRVKDKKIDV